MVTVIVTIKRGWEKPVDCYLHVGLHTPAVVVTHTQEIPIESQLV